MSTFIPHSCGVLKVEENWRRLNKFSIFPLLISFSFICQTSVPFNPFKQLIPTNPTIFTDIPRND
uniref:Uncharacterized protein n=1 Tax=Meloidogyne enterolobii TaxID=390850 RepID=A0A6V7TWN1_MELEN|nr:unnamed protein product [Meloidogyne enterolobii]